MRPSEAYRYVIQSDRRHRILHSITQPLTAKQLAKRTGLNRDSCCEVLSQLRSARLVVCLNEKARQSRLYAPTILGFRTQRRFRAEDNLPSPEFFKPVCDWNLYGRLCHRHRSAVLLAMTEPLQPSIIKRHARSRDSEVRMSANNVRDVMRLLVAWGVARPVQIRRRAHLRYELTEQGRVFQELLRQAEVRP